MPSTPRDARPAQVIGIASGKGGVGKTTVSVNLAVALAMRGARVMLLDGDMGLANAQLALGVQAPFNVGHVLRGEKTLREIIVTATQGVRLVPGASGIRELSALSPDEVIALVRAFDELDDPIDYLLVDVAAGISPSVVSLLAACQRRFVVLCDEPASIADAYALVKVLHQEGLDEIFLIPNQVASEAHGRRLHAGLDDVTRRFLGIRVGYLNAIEADEFVVEAHRRYQPVMEFAPGGSSTRDFRRLAQRVEDLPPRQPTGRIQFLMPRLLHAGQP